MLLIITSSILPACIESAAGCDAWDSFSHLTVLIQSAIQTVGRLYPMIWLTLRFYVVRVNSFKRLSLYVLSSWWVMFWRYLLRQNQQQCSGYHARILWLQFRPSVLGNHKSVEKQWYPFITNKFFYQPAFPLPSSSWWISASSHIKSPHHIMPVRELSTLPYYST